jgi:hypothetical protein
VETTLYWDIWQPKVSPDHLKVFELEWVLEISLRLDGGDTTEEGRLFMRVFVSESTEKVPPDRRVVMVLSSALGLPMPQRR